MNKLILILAMVFLMVGVVSAGENRTLYGATNISIPSGVVAGSSFEASFSFDYLDNHVNPENSPLIVQLNFTSNDSAYPVWRNDFRVSGRVEKSALWGFIPLPTVYFECNNSETQTIEHPLDAQTVQADNGTFYCYNSAGDLELEERDLITLDIVSHQAIYPGSYNLSAQMFYLTDERAPFVNITNKNVFDLYYREIDNVEILATISDGSTIVDKWGEAFLGYENWTVPFIEMASGDYRFSRDTPVDIVENDYKLFVFAKDEYNNTGNDSVTLKIDLTAPNISLIQPSSNSTYGENDSLVIKVGAVDIKAGLDNSTVMYRISEVVNGSFCPDSGVILGDYSCYNSGWVADWNLGDFETEINISGSDFVSGSYWLEARACDMLGNCGVL